MTPPSSWLRSAKPLRADRAGVDNPIPWVVWSVFGPHPHGCEAPPISWAVARYEAMVAATGGVYVPLADGSQCTAIDFEAALARLVAAL